MEAIDLDVLIVDDDETTRTMLAELLVQWGAHVRIADSAAQARVAFEQRAPTVLLSDIDMPGEDGYRWIRHVRGLAPEAGGNVAAIACTALAGPRERAHALACGFDAIVAKPVDVVELRAKLAQVAETVERAAAKAPGSATRDS